MKRIALVSDGWRRLVTYSWAEGMLDYINKNNEDICVYQFNALGNWSQDEKTNQGEYNIFNLANLDVFDAIVLDSINIEDEYILNKLVKKLKKTGLPVVSLIRKIDGFFYVGIENKKAIKEMAEHLYEKHDCRSFIFAGGPKDNPENALRVSAYREFLEKHQLSNISNPVWYGDYEHITGVKYFERIIVEKLELPDAFICANDNIASGIIACAEKYGYSVPSDFKVTGFDHLDKSIYFKPQISTVGHMREIIAGECVKVLKQIWDTGSHEDVFVPYDCVFTESCGCELNEKIDYREYAKQKLLYEMNRFYEDGLLVKLESNIVKQENFDDLFHAIGKYYSGLNCDNVTIVVDRRIYIGAPIEDFPTESYDWKNLKVVYASGNEEAGISSALDIFKNNSKYLFFSPIHFRERSIGFMILENPMFLHETTDFYDVQNTLMKTLENLYKKVCLEMANEKLKDIYNRDSLTGMYNRIACQETFEPKFMLYGVKGIRCAVAFIDIDFCKTINDTYGHKTGDKYIKTVANVINDKCPASGNCFRFGGDEFVVFFPCPDREHAEEFSNSVEAELKEQGISVSIGITLTEPYEYKNFEYYVHIADEEMYRVKKSKKNHMNI